MTSLLARGRGLRGVAAWVAAVAGAAVLAATIAIAYSLVRETVLHPPFPREEWWVFLRLWTPIALGGAALAALASAPLTWIAVTLIRRSRWPRPQADIAAGAVVGLAAVGSVILLLRTLAGAFG